MQQAQGSSHMYFLSHNVKMFEELLSYGVMLQLWHLYFNETLKIVQSSAILSIYWFTQKKKKEEKKFMVSKCIIKVYVYNRAINFSFFSLKSTLEARLSFIQHWRESLDCKLDFESWISFNKYKMWISYS